MAELQEDLSEIVNGNSLEVKSVVLTAKGSFDFVKVIDWPLVTQCEGDKIRVAVEYCGVNFADVYHIQGKLVQQPAPYVLGLECAGKVTEIGPAVSEFKVGDRVVCYCPDAGLFRQIVVLPSSQCFLIPQDICSKIACSLIANYLTAYFALFELGSLRNDQSILIHSAAGGVGWAATQLAAIYKNVKVYGTASLSKHEDIVNNGVSVPLTYDNFTTFIPKSEVDIVIDNIGGDNLKKSLAVLRPLGRLVLTGANCVVQEDESKVTQALESLGTALDLHSLVIGNKSLCGLHLGTLMSDSPLVVSRAIFHIFQLYLQGNIEPRVHTVYSFTKAVNAIKDLAERKNIGKILLKMEV